jgi:hypothetical protein
MRCSTDDWGSRYFPFGADASLLSPVGHPAGAVLFRTARTALTARPREDNKLHIRSDDMHG